MTNRSYEDGLATGVMMAEQVIAEALRDWSVKEKAGDGTGASDAMIEAVATALDAAKIGANGYIFRSVFNDTPLKWKRVDEARYDEMMGLLPPATMTGYGFLVGEPWDHHPIKGHPRFSALVQIPDGFFESTRPIGIKDFRNYNPMTVMQNLETTDA